MTVAEHGQNFEVEHPTSNIQHPTSNVQHPTSNIQRPTSNVIGSWMFDVRCWIFLLFSSGFLAEPSRHWASHAASFEAASSHSAVRRSRFSITALRSRLTCSAAPDFS